MAQLTSYKAEAQRHQSVTEFNRKIGSIGYSCWEGGQVTLGISFNAEDGERETKNKDRNFGLRFSTEEVSRIVGSLFNPSYTLGFFTTGHSDQLSDKLANKVMEDNGLYADRYRVPWDNKDGYLYVMGFNIRHALFQLRKLMKDKFDASKLEVEDAGFADSWQLCETKGL